MCMLNPYSFSTQSATKEDIRADRQNRYDRGSDRWTTVITAVRAEEVKHINSVYAKNDLPGVGDQLTAAERAEMEVSRLLSPLSTVCVLSLITLCLAFSSCLTGVAR